MAGKRKPRLQSYTNILLSCLAVTDSSTGLLNCQANLYNLKNIPATWYVWWDKLRWLETVSRIYILMGRYSHSLSLDATIMISKNFPTIGKHVVTIFVIK